MTPRVSLLLPNLNTRPYLDERMASIRSQTLQDWELVVLDGQSSDGSWEYLQACAAEDPRIRLHQSGERGIYRSFNHCVRLARGKFIYFATGDDTMEPDLLEKMTTALDAHPDCDLAHCKLRIIDEKGRISEDKNWDDFFIVRYFGDLIDRPHIRRAPHDGVLHFAGITAYTSLTQLLIRRSLFERIGFFEEHWGPVADYEWEMRAALVADTVHVPEYLASWRWHGDQATTEQGLARSRARGLFVRMAEHALKVTKPLQSVPLDKGLLLQALKHEQLHHCLTGRFSAGTRAGYLLRFLLENPGWLPRQLGRRHIPPRPEQVLRHFVATHHLESHLIPLDTLSPSALPLPSPTEKPAIAPAISSRTHTMQKEARPLTDHSALDGEIPSHNHPTCNDRWIVGLYQGKRRGYYVEAGALDGVSGSCTYILEHQYAWTGILVEPGSPFPALVNNRPGSICEPLCLAEREGRVMFVEAENPGFSGIKAVLQRTEAMHLARWGTRREEWRAGTSREKPVETITFHRLLQKHQAPQVIHYVAFDLEGAEYDVLKDFPFDEYAILAFSIEGDGCDELLRSKGYVQVTNPFNTEAPWEHYFLHPRFDELASPEPLKDRS